MFTKRCVLILVAELCLLGRLAVDSAPIDNQQSVYESNSVPAPEIFDFMRKFGYLDKNPSNSEALYHEDAVIEALKNVQKFGAIPQTGKLDNATMKLIASPRCGVSDVMEKKTNRTKRFVIGSSSWRKRKITYFIANWSPKVGEDKIAEHMKNAFDTWAKYGNLKFVRVYDPSADIIIGFGSSYHGDNYPFDGPGNILAHAFYPYEMNSYGGDIHFDNDENWVENATNLNEGVDFFSVAVHELGHSLGLAHSFVYSSIMFPYYKGLTKLQQLDYDDILAMYQLYIQSSLPDSENEDDEEDLITTTKTYFNYGEHDQTTRSTTSMTTPRINTHDYPSTRTTTTENVNRGFGPGANTTPASRRTISSTRRPPPPPTKTTTQSTPIISTTEQLPFITFEGDYETVDDHKRRWMITTNSWSEEEVPNVCLGHFDAVSVIRGETFIFKGRYLWRLNDKFRIKPGYPVTINKIFRAFPTDKVIDAAYEREADSAIILFSGKNYWVYNGTSFVEDSPRSIYDYIKTDDVESIDAVMVWGKNSKTYLFSESKFWRYDDETKKLDDDYPMHIDRWHGIPKDLDAAVTLTNGRTYFFKGNYYWSFNNYWIRPELGYPRKASGIWLGCTLN